MKKLHLMLFAALLGAALPATATDEQDQVHQAAEILQRFKSMPEKQIPRDILRHAKGLAILKVVKGGFIFSGKAGEGVVVARLGKGWSGPVFIHTAGVGFGAQIGGQVSEIVLVLNTQQAVEAFASGGNVELGGALSVAAGPVGRDAEAGVTTNAAVYTYSLSKGLFAGASLEGALIEPRQDANARYYHQSVSARSVLKGKVQSPKGGEMVASL